MKTVIIGGGNMGLCLGEAFLARKIVSAPDLLFVERDEEKARQIQAETGSRAVSVIGPELKEYDVILLAVKPQDASHACSEIARYLGTQQLVVSILAGTTVEKLKEMLGGHTLIVRCMPNLPAKVGEGLTAFYCTADVESNQAGFVRELFETCGVSLQLPEEVMIDAVTAVSGSGPGYVFYLLENMQAAARNMGFSKADADLLLRQTFKGALSLWEKSGEEPETLRKRVCSKGGTTERAISVFEEGRLGEVLQNGMLACQARAKEMTVTRG